MKVSILGSNINVFDSYQSVYSQIKMFLSEKSHSTFVTVNNVHTVTEGALNAEYKNIINHSFLALSDGNPLVLIGKRKGYDNMHRIFGPTLLEKTLEWSQKDNMTHFFFGSSNETIDEMKKIVLRRYPAAQVVGAISPPFRPFTEDENNSFIRVINESGADIIWVSLGAPKQEKWIYENFNKLNHGILVGVGAGFDYLTGRIKHAPKWMKNCSLEWLYRLLQEPRRLWKRYLLTNSLFILFVLLELLGLKKFNKAKT